MKKQPIVISAQVAVPLEKVWQLWTDPAHIVKWNAASADWHTTRSENDLRVGGRFVSRMEAKDGSFGFDFSGQYTEVSAPHRLAYTLDDDRQVQVNFVAIHNQLTAVEESFEPENTNPEEMQRAGWQAILDHFKAYAENHPTV